MDKPKMVLAGVDAGAKMLVELTGEPDVAAAAIVIKQNNNAKIRIAPGRAELCAYRIFHTKRVLSAAVCLKVSPLRRGIEGYL
jgi:hypothetical protein